MTALEAACERAGIDLSLATEIKRITTELVLRDALANGDAVVTNVDADGVRRWSVSRQVV